MLKNTAFPWWLSGKESTCQCRRHGFDPCSGKMPHASEQLSPRATAPEARAPWCPHSTTRDTIARRSLHPIVREQPLRPEAREKAHAETKTQHSEKSVKFSEKIMNFLKQSKKHWAQRAKPPTGKEKLHMQSCVNLNGIRLLNSSSQSWKTAEQYLQSSERKFFQPNTLYLTELLNKL